MMKAYKLSSPYTEYSEVVFAENSSKARALKPYLETFENVEYVDIRARRAPELDKYYKKGKISVDWDDPQDRLAMVVDGGFTCEYIEWDECAKCLATEDCETYQVYQAEREEEDEVEGT